MAERLPIYLGYFLQAQAFRSHDSPCVAVSHCKRNSVGDRSFCSVGPTVWNSFGIRFWNSRPHSLCASTLTCTDATPGAVSALRRLLLSPLLVSSLLT